MKEKESERRACYFLSLTVENLACFGKPQTINLSDTDGQPARWTVILGDNGTGKTALLRALATIFPSSHLAGRLRNGTKRATKIEAGIAVEFLFTKSMKRFKKLRTVIETEPGEPHNVKRDEANELESGKFICFGYGATRRMSLSKIAARRKDETPAMNLFDDDYPLIDVEELLLRVDNASSKNKMYSTYKQRVEEIILKLLPDVSGIDYKVDKQVSEVMFETPAGWVRIDQLSLGYRTMLAWIVDFAAGLYERYPRSKNPLEEPAVLLVDEIDLHLHPRWQRRVIDFLTERFPNTQFIVTTNSPLLVQTAADANLVLLKRKGDDIIIDNDPISVRSWRVDRILTSGLFGIESAYSNKTQRLLNERIRLLAKASLSTKDKEELELLDAALGAMTFDETVEENKKTPSANALPS
jgi:predicted ATP-binding protein involved in virulence